jgi:predicted Zn-dependent peptidase
MQKIFIIILLLQGWLMSAELKEIEVNGVKVDVIYEQSNYIPSTYMRFVFKESGFLNESKVGLADFCANILDEGTKKEGSFTFAKKLDAKAISLYASAGYETFNIEIEALKEHFGYAMERLWELLKDPNYTQEAYDKVLSQTLGKIEKNKTNYDYVALHKLKSIVFEGTHLAYPKMGTEASLKSISLEDVKSFINHALSSESVIVVVGGDISFEEASKYIQTTLTPLPKVKKTALKSVALKATQKIKEFYEESQQAYIYFASPFNIKYNDSDQYKAKVAAHILGAGGFGSRMMEEVRVKRGLAYSVWASFVNYRFVNYFSGALQTKVQSQDEAIEVVKKMLKEFVEKGVTQKELESAKLYILGSEPLKNESLSQRLHRAFSDYYYGRGVGYNKKELELIDKLTLKELNHFITSHPEIAQLSFAVVTAQKEKR